MRGDQGEEKSTTPAAKRAAGRRPLSHNRAETRQRVSTEETRFGEARRLNEAELNRLPKRTLLTIARREALPNRSKMNKAQLARTLRRHFRHAA